MLVLHLYLRLQRVSIDEGILKLILNACLLLAFFLFTPSVRAYEQNQLADCISSAKENSSIEGVSEISIEKYCDCALELIVDQGKEIRQSGHECAIKNF